MDSILKEGEQMMGGGNNNNQGQGQGNNNQNQSYDNQSNNQSSNQGNNQQQSTGNSGGGGFMQGMERNTEDAYINNEANSILTKEGLPSAMDGAVDGALDTEVNKYSKDL